MQNRMIGWLMLTSLTLAGAPTVANADASAPRPRRSEIAEATPTANAEGVVNINEATEAQLTLLPGIGPTKARAILTQRQRMQRFRRVEDLLRVDGIGRATFRRLRTYVTLEGPTTLATDVRVRRVPTADATSEEASAQD